MVTLEQVQLGELPTAVVDHKYAHSLKDNLKESWSNISYRATKHPMRAIGYTMRDALCQNIARSINYRMWLPAGRYLYASGRPYHQVNNCLLKGVFDSREGWSELMHKGSMALMTGAGVGVEYSQIRGEGLPIRKTGGLATGPIALMQMFNECGRGIMQGGSRRSAIWAGLRWDHPDIMKFIHIKDWPEEVQRLKAKDFNFPATLDHTNISVGLNDEFFEAYYDPEHPKYALAHAVYWDSVKQMLMTGEPGFSINCGADSDEIYRNAPVAGDTKVLTESGYQEVNDIVGIPTKLWTGYQWAEATFTRTKVDTETITINMTGERSITCDPEHEFFVREYTGRGRFRTASIRKVAAKDLSPGDNLDIALPSSYEVELNKESWTNGFYIGDGSAKEITLCGQKRELQSLLVGVTNSSTTPDGHERCYLGNGYDKDSYNPECIQSFLAGWFDADGSVSADRIRLSGETRRLVEVRRMLEGLGVVATISKPIPSGYGGSKEVRNLIIMSEYASTFARVIPCQRLDLEPFKDKESYRTSEIKVKSIEQGPRQDVYCCDVGVSEHSFVAEGVRISNCTEVTSADDDDICNLGSINMGNVDTIEQFEQLVHQGVQYLLAGSVYSDVPYQDVDRVRTKNRRLGLGLMGITEWLLKRGKPYAPDDELWKWLEIYQRSTEFAGDYADALGLTAPVKTRAIAPTGTISIVAETTGGIEPIFCVAYKRRYLKHSTWHYQYVVDPVAKRLINQGVNPELIEDAYDLSADVERRVNFQHWIQQTVDHGISSTINLPRWGSERNNSGTVQAFGDMLIRYLPGLRGITCYPDGARHGQPLVPVDYSEALRHSGSELVEESVDVCDITKGGSCGD